MIQKVVGTFDSPDLSWESFAAKLTTSLPQMNQGLYCFFLTNPLNEYILDNNPKPKTVLHRKGASLKPGKFEQGLLTRLKNYHDHLHWMPTPGAQEWMFTRCFKMGFVLDLSKHDMGLPSTARVFEKYWTECVNRFLRERGLLAPDPIRQLARAEWRYLAPSAWNPGVETDLRDFLSHLAVRIEKMIDIGRVP
jgi:hypothetical protein